MAQNVSNERGMLRLAYPDADCAPPRSDMLLVDSTCLYKRHRDNVAKSRVDVTMIFLWDIYIFLYI